MPQTVAGPSCGLNYLWRRSLISSPGCLEGSWAEQNLLWASLSLRIIRPNVSGSPVRARYGEHGVV
jgi:hypothetical protein